MATTMRTTKPLHMHHAPFFPTWNFLISRAHSTKLVNTAQEFSFSKLRYGTFPFNPKEFWEHLTNWVIPEKIHTPTTEGTVFWPPHPPGFPKLLKPLSPQDFQGQRPPPPPIWIFIKLLDTVILLYTLCRRVLLGT